MDIEQNSDLAEETLVYGSDISDSDSEEGLMTQELWDSFKITGAEEFWDGQNKMYSNNLYNFSRIGFREFMEECKEEARCVMMIEFKPNCYGVVFYWAPAGREFVIDDLEVARINELYYVLRFEGYIKHIKFYPFEVQKYIQNLNF